MKHLSYEEVKNVVNSANENILSEAYSLSANKYNAVTDFYYRVRLFNLFVSFDNETDTEKKETLFLKLKEFTTKKDNLAYSENIKSSKEYILKNIFNNPFYQDGYNKLDKKERTQIDVVVNKKAVYFTKQNFLEYCKILKPWFESRTEKEYEFYFDDSFTRFENMVKSILNE